MGEAELLDEGLGALAHHKHWEVLAFVFVGIDYKVHDRVERVLISIVSDSPVGISTDIHTIYLFQESFDLSWRIKEVDRHHLNSRLL